MAGTSTPKQETQAEPKSPSTRLLDLLAGWSAYVASDEDNGIKDRAVSASDLADLYQAAGAASVGWDDLSEQDQECAVRAFVGDHIVPLLFGSAARGATRESVQAA